MGGSDEVVKEGCIFTRIMLGGSVVIVLLFMINGFSEEPEMQLLP